MPDPHVNVEYARRLWDNTVYWYGSADTKAQVILTLDGAFLAFLTGSIFSKPDDLKLIVSQFSSSTWVLLGLMLVSLLTSIFCAIFCIWARLHPRKEVIERLKKNDGNTHYHYDVLWFFQFIGALEQEKFLRSIEALDVNTEIKVLGEDIFHLARNIRVKHIAVNTGFILIIITLILFFLAALSYMLPLI